MMKRRDALFALGGALPVAAFIPSIGCAAGDQEVNDMSNARGLPPWHLWGGQDQATLTLAATAATLQLAKVNYNRPDTWSFLFFLQNINTNTGAAGAIQAHFDMIIGVGRYSVTLPDFAVLTVPIAAPAGAFQWVTQAQQQGPGTGVAPAPAFPFIQEFPAETINCNARITSGGLAPGASVTVQVAAFFAPRSHIRPEWFKPDFSGGELGGR